MFLKASVIQHILNQDVIKILIRFLNKVLRAKHI